MIYILTGEDEERIRMRIQEIQEQEKPDTLTRFNLERSEDEAGFQAAAAISLFFEKEMIVFDHASFLYDKNAPERHLKNAAEIQPEEKILVYTAVTSKNPASLYKGSAKKDAKKKEWMEKLCKNARVETWNLLMPKDIEDFVRQELKKRDVQMEPDALDWFVHHAGSSAGHLCREIDKLKLYGDFITLADVKALVAAVPTEDVFAMSNALFEKNAVRLLELYRNFRNQNMEPLAVLMLLASQIRFLFQVRVLMDQGLDQAEIAKTLGESSGRIWHSMKRAGRFNAAWLLGQLEALSVLDEQMKTGAVDKDAGFENWIMKIDPKLSRL